MDVKGLGEEGATIADLGLSGLWGLSGFGLWVLGNLKVSAGLWVVGAFSGGRYAQPLP